jgi:RNA polymerase sigma-70 factor (ECF subfamily)
VALSDGGGVKQALLRPLVGADKVARLLTAHFGVFEGEEEVELAQINGRPALILRLDGEIESVVALRIDDGLVTGLYVVRNPEKLSHVEQETAMSR